MTAILVIVCILLYFVIGYSLNKALDNMNAINLHDDVDLGFATVFWPFFISYKLITWIVIWIGTYLSRLLEDAFRNIRRFFNNIKYK